MHISVFFRKLCPLISQIHLLISMKLKFTIVLCFLFASIGNLFAQNLEVSGIVKDDKGEPLLGVFVLIKGTQRGASTDLDGHYTLHTKVGDVLLFSFLGMKSVEKKVTANSKVLNVTMVEDVQELEGTVVMGYSGKKVASRTVASVATVQGKEIADIPGGNVIDALQGKVAGMVVTTDSGTPGSASSVLIHGFNSFASMLESKDQQLKANSPLYIVDGVPVDSSVMTILNPADFESVSILKDAASTSIYGARAANGVILITTKRGKRNERTNITINHQLGVTALTNVTRKYLDKLATPREYMDFWLLKSPSEIVAAGNRLGYTETDPAAVANHILADYPYNTRWDKVFLRDFVPTSRTDIAASGGNEHTTYYVSLGYLNQEGMRKSSKFNRYNASLNVDTQVADWLKGGLSFSYAHSDNDIYTNPFESEAEILALPFYSPTDKNGKTKDFINAINGARNGFYHPDYIAKNYLNKGFVDDIMPIGYLTLEPIKNLTLKTQAGIQYTISEGEIKGPMPSFINYKTGASQAVGRVERDMQKSIQKTYTNLLQYKFDLTQKHLFDVLLGQESIENTGYGFSASSQGQPSEALMMLAHGNQEKNVRDNKSVSTFNSFFSRLEYSYNNRYFLDLSARRDGSSAFIKNHRYQNFWAVGAMWKAKEEKFLQKVDWLTDLNFRFSTGIAGSARIGDYRNMILAEADNSVTYNGQLSFRLAQVLGNPNLVWEEQRKSTFGVNFVLAAGNTSFNIEYYDRHTYNTLSTRELNSIFGYTRIPDNIGDMQNRGIDFSFATTAYRDRDKRISVRPYLNMNYNSQKITNISYGKPYALNRESYMGYKVGKAAEWVLPIFKGIDNNGDAQWYEAGDDKLETQMDDSKVTKTYNPVALAQSTGKKRYAPINGGFGCDATYKDFSLSVTFAYSIGKYNVNEDKATLLNPGYFGVKNISKDLFNYWKQPGDDTEIPRLDSDVLMWKDSRILEKADYLRMKNINLSYNLPQTTIDQLKIVKAIRLSVSAQNIFTLTKFSGVDPDYTRGIIGGYPPTRQYTFGVELKF